jgi:1,4-dihydroxy-2-naphthoyl-CoA hydrolase
MNLRQAAFVEYLNTHSAMSAAHHCGIRVEEIGKDWVEASMPFDARTRGTDGSLRLGALAILAETLGSLAAAISVDRDKFVCLGQAIQVIHLNSAAMGPIKARATPLLTKESGRQIWQIAISDASSTPIGNAKLTVVILPLDQLSR